MENYGAAVADGERAIELDTSFVKGYYRKGAACMALGRFKEGRDCFRRVAKATGSRDAQIKLKECETAIRRIRFEEAISSPDSGPAVSTSYGDSVDPKTMEVEDSYTGTRMDDDAVKEGDYIRAITAEVIDSMIEGFKNQSLIHKKYAFVILCRVRQILEASPTIEEVDVPEGKHFTVCGDVHGQFFDLCNIFEINGRPSPENPYLFNGDFVDRGSFSVEVIFTLFGYKCLYPDAMFMTRGNHEAKSMNRMYGFDGEVRAKYSNLMAEFFAEIFCFLPLGCVLNSRVLVVHGGLFSRPDVTLDDLKKIDRNREPPESGDMCDILWSDPMDEDGMGPSKRGVAVNFGPDVTRAFLENNNLDLLVRSHEMKEEGYEVAHGGKCITIFSAPNYCGMYTRALSNTITCRNRFGPFLLSFPLLSLFVERIVCVCVSELTRLFGTTKLTHERLLAVQFSFRNSLAHRSRMLVAHMQTKWGTWAHLFASSTIWFQSSRNSLLSRTLRRGRCNTREWLDSSELLLCVRARTHQSFVCV